MTKEVFCPKRLFTRNCVNNATREWADSIVEEGDGFRAYGEEKKFNAKWFPHDAPLLVPELAEVQSEMSL